MKTRLCTERAASRATAWYCLFVGDHWAECLTVEWSREACVNTVILQEGGHKWGQALARGSHRLVERCGATDGPRERSSPHPHNPDQALWLCSDVFFFTRVVWKQRVGWGQKYISPKTRNIQRLMCFGWISISAELSFRNGATVY